MTRNLSRETEMELIQKPLASGGSDPFSSLVDMQSHNSIMLIGICSSAGSTDVVNLKAYESTTSTATSTSDGLTALSTAEANLTTTAAQENGLLRMDIIRPRKRFVGAKLTRSAVVEWGGTLAIRYDSPRNVSSTKTSTDDLKTPALVMPNTTGSTST
jgi:hypothetical protein